MHKVENKIEVHHVNAVPSISEETNTELKKNLSKEENPPYLSNMSNLYGNKK
jgi:hypothetical protein